VRGKQREGCWGEFEACVAYLVHAAKPAVLGRERHASRIVATVLRTTQGGHQPGRHGIIARLDGIRDNEFTGRCADLHLGACVRDTREGSKDDSFHRRRRRKSRVLCPSALGGPVVGNSAEATILALIAKKEIAHCEMTLGKTAILRMNLFACLDLT
jgi:hypothetical protein